MKFRDFIDVRDGTHDSPKSVSGIGYPLVTTKHLGNGFIDLSNTNNISEEDYIAINKRSKVDQFDILISMIGTVGSVYQERQNQPGYAIKNVGLLKFNGDETLSNYVYYWLKSSNGQNEIKVRLKGTTQQFLSLTELRNLTLELPSREEMNLAVKPLMILDQKMYSLGSINDNLLELADATFEKNYEQQVGNQKLETLATVKGGKRLPKGAPLTEVKTQHPYLRITDYSKNGVPSVQSMQYITEEMFDKISRYVINEGEVFLSIVGTIGIVDLIDERLDNASLTENAVKIHAQTTAMAHYLYLYLRSDEGRHEIDSRTVGTTQKKLAITRIKDFDVGVISETDLQEFERTVSPLINMVLANRSEIDTLVQIRDSLLQELI